MRIAIDKSAMQICSYAAVSGAEYCVLGFQDDEERIQLLDVLRDADCFLDSLAAKVNFSSLARRLEKHVTAPEGMRDAASCVVLKSEDATALMDCVLTMLKEAAARHKAREQQDLQLKALCSNLAFDTDAL